MPQEEHQHLREEFDRRRILVVDDEERMVRFIRMNLEHDGFQVIEAFNGKQAIDKLRDTPDRDTHRLLSARRGVPSPR